VIILKRGRIEEDDSPEGIMARYSRATLEEVFLDVARGRAQENSGAASTAPSGAKSKDASQETGSRETLP